MALPAEKIEFDPSTLPARALEQTNNVIEATLLLESWAQDDRRLREHLVTPAILHSACYDAIRSLCRENRDKIWTAANYTKGGNGARVKSHAMSLLDFPLPGGKLLRDAKRADLFEAAEFYRKQATDMQAKAAWLSAIADRVGRKKVDSVFDAEALAALRHETE